VEQEGGVQLLDVERNGVEALRHGFDLCRRAAAPIALGILLKDGSRPSSPRGVAWRTSAATSLHPRRPRCSAGAAAVPICRETLSDEMEVYEEDMLRPWR